MASYREPLYQTPAPNSWPRGVESVIHYGDQGEWVLNDARRVDAIIVTGISGLGGPDLSVTADESADRDGENPNDPRYGGRTVTLTGYVRAGNLEMMRHLVSYIEDAFDDPREQPLWFRWLDWRDVFQDSNALIDYRYDSGSGLVIAADGSGLTPTNLSPVSLGVYPIGPRGDSPARLTYGDGEATVAFNVASSYSGLTVGVESRRSTSGQKLRVVYDKDTNSVKIQKVVGGTVTTEAQVGAVTAQAVGTTCFLRARFKGDVVTYSFWDRFPTDSLADASFSGTYTLSSGTYTTFPSLAQGTSWGLYWKPNSVGDRVLLLDVGAIDKGDAVIRCRKAVPVEFNEEQATGEFRRSFMVTLRASSSRMVSRKITTVSSVPGTFSLIFPAGGSGLIFPADGSGLIFGGYLPNTITNLGRSPAAMIVRFIGGMVNPVLTDPVTGRTLGIEGTINDLDFVEFNTERRTVVNSAGLSVYDRITDETSWPELLPGANRFIIGADSVSSTGVVIVSYRHSSR